MNPLDDIDAIKTSKTGRLSSWDKSGGNRDRILIPPGGSAVIADIKGPGKITHIWLTQHEHYRDCAIRITWDNAPHPSVLCPLGDFFCLGNCVVNSFESALFTASTRLPHRLEVGGALNCYVPMRFRERALVEIVNESAEEHMQYFYVDFETWDPGAEEIQRGYFHAEFRRCNPFRGWGPQYMIRDVVSFPNTERCAWENNYTILDTKGAGHYIGCNLSVTNLKGNWWGEGDDMIWIDGYKWPPDIHGTGAEDYFNQAWGMNETAFLRNGSSVWEGDTSQDSRYTGGKAAYAGRLVGGYQTSYVFHLENPIRFNREIKVTIEGGHANHQANEISSVAYWYSQEPVRVVDLPPAAKRRPILRDTYGNWLIDEASQCPGPDVRKNAEFLKVKAEYDALAPKNNWPRLEIK